LDRKLLPAEFRVLTQSIRDKRYDPQDVDMLRRHALAEELKLRPEELCIRIMRREIHKVLPSEAITALISASRSVGRSKLLLHVVLDNAEASTGAEYDE